MKQGNKVRRPKWDKSNYIEIVGTTRYIQDKYKVVEVTLSMIEATDWEIYEEVDDWSLKKDIELLSNGNSDTYRFISCTKKLKKRLKKI